MKKTMMALVMTIFSLGFIIPFGAKADTLPIGKCTMTITQNATGSNYAQADGPCIGLEKGVYSKEQNQYIINGLVVMPVEHSGQQFTIYLPSGNMVEAILTVYTEQSSINNPIPSSTSSTPSAQTKTGWVYNKGTWYFYYANGTMKTGWEFTGGNWYFLQNNGVMKTGWVFWGGKWYFLENSGAMKTGWVYTGKWYFLDNNGAMKNGWVSSSGKWYYLYSNGAMAQDTKIGSYRIGHDGSWMK